MNWGFWGALVLFIGAVPNVFSAPQLAKIAEYGTGIYQDVAVRGNYAYVAVHGLGLEIYDITDPKNPKSISSVRTSSGASSIALLGNYAVLSRPGLKIIDVSDPHNPKFATQIPVGGHTTLVHVEGNKAYFGAGPTGACIVDLSDLKAIKGGCPVSIYPGYPNDVAMEEGLLYVATEYGIEIDEIKDYQSSEKLFKYAKFGAKDRTQSEVILVKNKFVFTGGKRGLAIYDARNPRQTKLITEYDTGSAVLGLSFVGDHLYVSGWNSTLQILDIQDPAKPKLVSKIQGKDLGGRFFIKDKMAFVAAGKEGLSIYDLGDLAHPYQIAKVGATIMPHAIKVEGSRAYMVENVSSQQLRILDIKDASHPTLLGIYALPAGQIAAFHVFHNRVIVISQGFYNDETVHWVTLLDVSDPSKVKRLGLLPIPDFIEHVEFDQNYAYVISGGLEVNKKYNLEVFEFSGDFPRLLSITPFGSKDEPYYSGKFRVSDKKGYWLGNRGNFFIMDLSNPEDPKFISKGVTKDSEIDDLSDLLILGRYIVAPDWRKKKIHTFEIQGQSSIVLNKQIEMKFSVNRLLQVGKTILAFSDNKAQAFELGAFPELSVSTEFDVPHGYDDIELDSRTNTLFVTDRGRKKTYVYRFSDN
ncbi:MAG: hypothetical protein AB1540_17775 [Bdellovibrionota bacterium]